MTPEGSYSCIEEEDKYPFHTGLPVIIINDKCRGHEQRMGSKTDMSNLQQMFTRRGFEQPIVLKDFGSKALLENLLEISRQDFSSFDCLAVAISTHGKEVQTEARSIEDVISTSDGEIKTKMILEMFIDEKCPSLAGKPRLFFIQACRGSMLDSGQEVQSSSANSSSNEQTVSLHARVSVPVQRHQRPVTRQGSARSSVNIDSPLREVHVRPAPCYKDFLVMYATPPGYFAFRNPDDGSWFIQCLCKVLLGVDQPMNFTQCLTRVIAAVAKEKSYAPSNPNYDQKMQTPVIYSMLTKDLILLPIQS